MEFHGCLKAYQVLWFGGGVMYVHAHLNVCMLSMLVVVTVYQGVR